jgi:hypothetical protein
MYENALATARCLSNCTLWPPARCTTAVACFLACSGLFFVTGAGCLALSANNRIALGWYDTGARGLPPLAAAAAVVEDVVVVVVVAVVAEATLLAASEPLRVALPLVASTSIASVVFVVRVFARLACAACAATSSVGLRFFPCSYAIESGHCVALQSSTIAHCNTSNAYQIHQSLLALFDCLLHSLLFLTL